LGIFAVGLLLKEVFADGLAPLVDRMYQPGAVVSRIDAWAAAIGFGGQIYADFWGYSTVAVGLARMFGVDIPVNFRLPYLARSLREFWRRWHITLSQWLRDYLYKPLGGSRHGAVRTVLALMATMLLGGIWHGANYTFVVWGAIHGAALVAEHLLLGRGERAGIAGAVAAGAGWLYTFIIVMVAWVFFRAPDLGQAGVIVKAMFAGTGDLAMSSSVRQIAALAGVLLLVQIPVERLLEVMRGERLHPAWALAVSFWSVAGAVVLGAPAAVPFIYFQF
jgi:D-alanyl-lipoteichoic acid acyltransferase DltB (MBOAT superfamily)